MIPKTTKVFGRIHTQSGLPATRARGFATLDRFEIDNGFVVPHTVRISCDSEGYFETDFWPNSRGSGGSSYTLELNYQGEEVFKESFVVPELEYPVNILDIFQLQPYPSVSQSQQILTETQALLLEVKANATLTQDNTDKVVIDKETTLHASALATEQAIRAGNSAVESLLSEDSARDIQIDIQTNISIATDKVVEASISAQSALESKNTAALSEQNAVQAKEKAEAWAENPEDNEVEVGQYSAKHHAAKAQLSAIEAQNAVGQPQAVVPATASRTLGLLDSGAYLLVDSLTDLTITVPAESGVDFPVGTDIALEQHGAGAIALGVESGVTINVAAGFELKTGGQYAVVSLKKVAADTWTLFGNLEVLE